MIGRHFLRAAIAAALLGSGSTAAVAANLGFTGSVTGIST
jgi:hypothetical protein